MGSFSSRIRWRHPFVHSSSKSTFLIIFLDLFEVFCDFFVFQMFHKIPDFFFPRRRAEIAAAAASAAADAAVAAAAADEFSFIFATDGTS